MEDRRERPEDRRQSDGRRVHMGPLRYPDGHNRRGQGEFNTLGRRVGKFERRKAE
jgi:hypothetical protein